MHGVFRARKGEGRMAYRRVIVFALAVLLGEPALAQTKVHLAYTATGGFVGAFVAAEKGFFAKHGLEVEFQLIGLNSNIPPAMVAGSIDIGGTTMPGLLQAADGGLPLVVVSGGTYQTKASTAGAILARPDAGITKPADFVGKKIGVPGIGASFHVLTEYWLLKNGVDPKQVTYVELGFLQMKDALGKGLVDAVTTAEPSYSQILQAGVGKEVGRTFDAIGKPTIGIVYTATSDWASSHKDLVRGFDAANAEAASYYPAHQDEARAAMAKYLHMTPQVANAVELADTRAEVKAADIEVMIEVMDRLHLLSTRIDPNRLLAP
jgi:NitT/TauT family transport system substrate-binding protein